MSGHWAATFTFLHPLAFIFALFVLLGPTGEVTGSFVLTVCAYRRYGTSGKLCLFILLLCLIYVVITVPVFLRLGW
jgi:hypothetical protein